MLKRSESRIDAEYSLIQTQFRINAGLEFWILDFGNFCRLSFGQKKRFEAVLNGFGKGF
jgi:hypothetical protein